MLPAGNSVQSCRRVALKSASDVDSSSTTTVSRRKLDWCFCGV